jgi:hypothetical protein
VLDKILPEQVNNEFPGYKFAQYAFVVFAIFTIARSLIHMFLPDGGAGSIATIDLNVEGAEVIIGMFAQWGLSQLLMAGLYVVVYARYKSLIPLMYLIIVIEYAGRIAMGLLKPIETVGTAPGGIVNIIFIPLAAILLVFSIMKPKTEGE